MDISFGMTSEALLAGAKTCTRRDWIPQHAEQFNRQFEQKRVVRAWDRSPRFGGKAIAFLRLTAPVEAQPLSEMPDSDYEAEGFAWYCDHPREISENLRKFLNLQPGRYPDRHWFRWFRFNGFSGVKNTLYVVRFEVDRLC